MVTKTNISGKMEELLLTGVLKKRVRWAEHLGKMKKNEAREENPLVQQ